MVSKECLVVEFAPYQEKNGDDVHVLSRILPNECLINVMIYCVELAIEILFLLLNEVNIMDVWISAFIMFGFDENNVVCLDILLFISLFFPCPH